MTTQSAKDLIAIAKSLTPQFELTSAGLVFTDTDGRKATVQVTAQNTVISSRRIKG